MNAKAEQELKLEAPYANRPMYLYYSTNTKGWRLETKGYEWSAPTVQELFSLVWPTGFPPTLKVELPH